MLGLASGLLCFGCGLSSFAVAAPSSFIPYNQRPAFLFPLPPFFFLPPHSPLPS